MRLLLLLILSMSAGGCGPAPVSCDAVAPPGRHSLQRMADRLEAGETGCLRAGRYGGDAYALHVRAGHGDVTILGPRRGVARLQGSVWIAAPHVTLRRVSVEGSGVENAVKVYASRFRLLDSRVTTRGLRGSCILLGSPTAGLARGPVLARNVLADCGSLANGNQDHAIYASRVRGGRIADNLIVRPAGYGIQLYPDAHGVVVAGNVLDGRGSNRGGIVLGSQSGHTSSDNRIEGNVIDAARPGPLVTAWSGPVGAGNAMQGNCVSATVQPAAGVSLGINPVVPPDAGRCPHRAQERVRALASSVK